MANMKLQIKGVEALKERLNKKKELFVASLGTELMQLGEAAVTHAKNNKGYQDRTGNLKNSISYALFLDGELVQSVIGDIPHPEKTEEGQEGVEEALTAFAGQSGFVASKGYTIIVVAGMNYGKHVEDKGYNVLHLTKYFLKDEMVEIFNEAIKRINES